MRRNYKAHYYHLTPEGLTELQARLQALQTARSQKVDELRDYNTQSTSGSLEDSIGILYRHQVAEFDDQITALERIVANARLITKPTGSDRVRIGSQVTVDVNGDRRTYLIVDSIEADPSGGKISDESPFGQSLLGKRVDESVELLHASRSLGATVVAID